jgi:small conductance mechanosensitive channel
MTINPDALTAIILRFALRAGLALLILLVAKWIAHWLRRKIPTLTQVRRLTPSMISLLTGVVFYGTWIAAGLLALTVVGFPMSTILALGSVSVLVLGVAWQESLRDLAAGVHTILFRPYWAGDVIETRGLVGRVVEVQLFSTLVELPDRRIVTLANSEIRQAGVTRSPSTGPLRGEVLVRLSYDSELSRAKEIALELMRADQRVLSEPAPEVLVAALDPTSVNLLVRPYTLLSDSLAVLSNLRENIKLRYDAEGIAFAPSQTEMRVAPTAAPLHAEFPPSERSQP